LSQIQQSFDRIAVLKIFQRQAVTTGPSPSLLNVDPIGTAFPSKLSNGDPGFRIKFHIEKVTGPVPVPNPSVIHIYNLGKTSRAIVSKLNNLLVLEAGYGTSPQTIFSGNVSYAVTKKEGPDYVTEIHAADGLFAFQNSLINTSFSQSTPTASVLTTLISALNSAGIKTGISTGVPTSMYNKGVVLSGRVVDLLKDVCEKNDLSWTIEDGAVNIVPYGGALTKPVVILSPSTGLIGIPELREVDSTGKGSLVSFKCLLNPQLGTFQLITILSKFINGIYTTAKIIHSGDTFGLEWYTEGEAT
jgi:hypothetical protein